jgi:23S rRNA (cytidine1920-2'-O)/16S rRNA (cytidine1409-2'-O)-methyltransferase
MTGPKKRLDQLLVESNLAETRQRARSLIMAGLVRVDGSVADKPGHMVHPTSSVDLLAPDHPYVSRGGLKLEAAIREFAITVQGLTVLDVGASTGGFTDCLLRHGAKKVVAVDVGYGQLAWSLRNDPRVVVLERRNIRHLSALTFEEDIDGAVIDTSFISLRIVVPAALRHLKKDSFLLALIKPQFIRDVELQKKVVAELTDFFTHIGLEVLGTMESPITGAKGNREYFTYLRYR